MQCVTCSADIPPQWTACLKANICPGCSGPIMNEAAKELLEELREAITKMSNDPAGLVEGLAGWLLSNYNLVKVGTGEPVGFHHKSVNSAITNKNNERKLKVANNPVQDFLRRTGVSRNLDERKNYQEIVEQINSGEVDETRYGEVNAMDSDVEVEENNEDNEVAYQEAESNRRQMQNMVLARKQQLKNSLLVPNANHTDSMIRPVSPHEVEVVMDNLAKKVSNFDEVPALNAARMQRLKAQEEVAMGGRAGVIRRRD